MFLMLSLINELSKTKKELESLQPDDRMSLVVAINRAVSAIAMSAGGWQQFLTDAMTLEKFDRAKLTSFFEYFKQEAIRQLEFDVQVLTENADIIGPMFPRSTVAPRPRGAYA
jgi:hypothetical protein